MHTSHSQSGSSKAGTAAVLAFDFDALLADLAANKSPDSGPANTYTTAELIERTGKSLGSVRKLVLAAQQAGKCKPTLKRVPSIDGRERRVPAYEFEG